MGHYILLSIAVLFLAASIGFEWWKVWLARQMQARYGTHLQRTVNACVILSRLFCWIGIALMFVTVAIFI